MNRSRLVAVRADGESGGGRVGSGCVIAPRLVLTAGHALPPRETAGPAAGARVRVRVQLFTARRLVPAAVVWDGRPAGLDAALLEVAPEDWPPDVADSPVRFGRFVTLRAGQPADALGFARAQASSPAGLETAQVSGTVSPGDRMIADRWELGVDRAPADLGESPWSGMSGAALWSGPLLCGVVVVDSAHWNHGKLQAVPAHRLLAQEEFRSLLARRTGYVPSAEAVELEALCEPAVPSRAPRLPSELLRPQAEAVPFTGRDRELRDFEDWCVEGGGLATRLITGLGGQGKSRFARELSARMATRGWVAALLRESAAERDGLVRGLRALTAVDQRMLLVMDYAETSPELIGDVLEVLEARGGHHPVRIVLIRSAGEWWEQLPGATARSAGTLSGAHTVELRDVATTPARRALMYEEAVRALARRLPGLGELTEYARVDWAEVERAVLSRPYRDFDNGSALHLHMRALLHLLTEADLRTDRPTDGPPDGRGGSRGSSRAPAGPGPAAPRIPRPGREPDVRAQLLGHERRYWKRTAGAWSELDGLGHDVLADAVATATLTRTADPRRATELLGLLPGLAGEERIRAAAKWLHRLYPPTEASYWGALEPDLLGEYHVALRCRGNRALLGSLLPRLGGREAERALTVLARAEAQPGCPCPDLAEQVADLIVGHPDALAVPAVVVAGRSENPGFLLHALHRLVERPDLPLDLLEVLHAAVPDRSRLLGEQALDIARRLVHAHRRRARLAGGVLAPAPVRADLAGAEHNLAVRLSSVRRWTDAVERSGRAVRLYRGLARSDPGAYLPLLAESIGVRWGALFELGRYREALADCTEAVQVGRRLVAGGSGVRTAGGSGARTAAGSEARTAAGSEARTAAASMPHRARLAQALSSLSVVLASRYLRAEALSAGEEAVEILEELVRDRPTRQHLALLAGALHNLANRRSPGQDALETVTHAVLIRRRLAQVHPDAYLPALVESLHNQALELTALNRYSAAVRVIDECLRVTLHLVEDQPTIHRPTLARVLGTRAGALSGAGAHTQAVRTAVRALLLLQDLARERPAEYEQAIEAMTRHTANVAWDAYAGWDEAAGAAWWLRLHQEANRRAAVRRERERRERWRATRWRRVPEWLGRWAGIRLTVSRRHDPARPAARIPRFGVDLTVPPVPGTPDGDERIRDQREFRKLLDQGDLIRVDTPKPDTMRGLSELEQALARAYEMEVAMESYLPDQAP
ncbi:tetratricopeptide repeat protein [Streptomyces sp. NPDC003247]|uniref:tetratricopeptide repeat protein n=1 Tax=Streptomyces sp. NPDC003247 TaxID=3364677 RepID=UPI00368E6979